MRRNALRSRPLYRFSAPLQNINPAHHALVIACFNACQGGARGFRFKDWADYSATAEPQGTIVSHSITTTTISAASSDRSFNDSGAGFIGAGFVVGDRIKTTVTGNTTLTYTIVSVTASKIVVDQPVTTQASGGTFSISTLTASIQIKKNYACGSENTERPIRKPVSGTVTVYANAVAKAGTLDATTGQFAPTSPWIDGDVVTATFEFDVPVMFASDEMIFDYANFNALTTDIELLEDFSA